MRKSSFAALALIGSVALVGATVTPAMAAEPSTDGTTTTVAVAGGSLTMGSPTTAALTSITSSSAEQTVTATLTDISVIDNRASTATWNATVVLSPFVGAAGSTTEIPLGTATYVPTDAVVTVSAQTVVLKATTTPGLAVAQSVQASAGNTSSHTATWGATVTVKVPALALADTYTATLTHSVS